MAFPTRGVELIVQPIVNAKILGWTYGCNFNRRGHDYHVRLYAGGLYIERDGQQVRRWDDLPANVQTIIRKQKAALESAP